VAVFEHFWGRGKPPFGLWWWAALLHFRNTRSLFLTLSIDKRENFKTF